MLKLYWKCCYIIGYLLIKFRMWQPFNKLFITHRSNFLKWITINICFINRSSFSLSIPLFDTISMEDMESFWVDFEWLRRGEFLFSNRAFSHMELMVILVNNSWKLPHYDLYFLPYGIVNLSKIQVQIFENNLNI